MLHFARSRYGAGYIRAIFAMVGAITGATAVAALISDHPERLPLAAVATVVSVSCLVCAVFVRKLGAK